MTAPLRTLLVGFGGVAQGLALDPKMSSWFPVATHAQALRADNRFNWVGVVDPQPDARRAATEDWSIPAFSDVQSAAHLEPDVVVLATPPGSRCDAMNALPSLKGALIEKPLPHTECVALQDICNARDIAAQVNYWRRGDDTLRSLANGILHKRIGDLQSGHAVYGNGLRNNGSHLLDMIRWLVGEPTSIIVTGAESAPNNVPIPGDVHVPFSLGFADGGTIAVHPVDFAHYREVGLDLWGTRGRITLLQETLDVRVYDVVENRGLSGTREIASDTGHPLESAVARALPNLYDNLYQAIDGDADLLSPLSNAAKTEDVIARVLASAQNDTAHAAPQ